MNHSWSSILLWKESYRLPLGKSFLKLATALQRPYTGKLGLPVVFLLIMIMMIMTMIVATVTSFIDTLFIIIIAVDTFCIIITTYYISFSPRRRQSIIVTTYDGWFIFHQLGLGLVLVISENWTLAELDLLVSIPIPYSCVECTTTCNGDREYLSMTHVHRTLPGWGMRTPSTRQLTTNSYYA